MPLFSKPMIIAYVLSAVVEGNAKSRPIGKVPAFDKSFQTTIRGKHNPNGRAYINETVNGVSVIIAWVYDHADAVCFLSENEAKAWRGFQPLSDTELATGQFPHFP